MGKPFRGIFSIAYTPFDEGSNLLFDDLGRICDWVARSGAHGLVWPVMASEFTVISYPERVRGMRLAVQAVAGRIPVVIGVHDVSKAGAVALAEEAAKAGADAVIAMPPWGTKMENRDLIEEYYRAIAEAAGVPVIVQNAGAPLGSALPGAYVVELCEKVPLVQYLKEEKPPQGHAVSEVINLGGPNLKGVFSGAACFWIIPEYRRGVCGNMPGSYIPDVDAQIWDLLEAGSEVEARRIHNAKLVLENSMRSMGYPQVAKEILRRRGIISFAAARHLNRLQMDKEDIAELEYGLSVVAPYLRAP